MGFPTVLLQVTLAPAGGSTQSAPAAGTPAGGTPAPAPVAASQAVSTQTQSSTLPAPGGAARQQPGILEQFGMPLMMVLVFVALYFILFRGQRKEEKNRKSAIEAMKKGDEVLLISGKFGKVVDIRDDRVVVKVDEANNVKETYLKSAIQRVMKDGEPTKKA